MKPSKIRDYLNTQGLSLPVEALQMATITLAAVYQLAEVRDLPDDLWTSSKHGFDAVTWLEANPRNNAFLRSLFAVIDSVTERFPAHAALYLMAEHSAEASMTDGEPFVALNRVWHQACQLPVHINSHQHAALLLHRSAQTGWAYVVDDAQRWHHNQDLSAAESKLGLSQLLLPLCHDSGRVLGVLYLTAPEPHAFDSDAQIWWVAATLVLADACASHFPAQWWGMKDDNDIPTTH